MKFLAIILLITFAFSAQSATYKKIGYHVKKGDTCETIIKFFGNNNLNSDHIKKIEVMIRSYNPKIKSCNKLKPKTNLTVYIPNDLINEDVIKKYVLRKKRNHSNMHDLTVGLAFSLTSHNFTINSGPNLGGEGTIQSNTEFGLIIGWEHFIAPKWKLVASIDLVAVPLISFTNFELTPESYMSKDLSFGAAYILDPLTRFEGRISLTDQLVLTDITGTAVETSIRMTPNLLLKAKRDLLTYKNFQFFSGLDINLYLGGTADSVEQQMGFGFALSGGSKYPIRGKLGNWLTNSLSLKQPMVSAELNFKLHLQNSNFADQSNNTFRLLFSISGLL